MFLEKFILGVSLSAPYGPLSAEAIRRGLQDGFLPAYFVRLGGALANLICLIIVYFGLSYIMQHSELGEVAGAVGSVILLYLGFRTIKQASVTPITTDNKASNSNHVFTGLALGVFNPFGIIWWLSVFSTSMAHSNTPWGSLAGLSQNLIIIIGVLCWITIFSGLIAFARRLMNDRIIYFITLLAGTSLVGFGVYYGVLTIRYYI